MKRLILLFITFIIYSVSLFSQSTEIIRPDTIKHVAKGNDTKLFHDANAYNFNTNKDTFNFNKPISVNGEAVGGSVIPMSFGYTYSTNTTDSRPGQGLFRLNNATYSNVTQVYIDYYDIGNVVKNNFFALSDTGTYISIITDNYNYINYKTNGYIDAGDYYKFNVTYVNSNGLLSGEQTLSFDISDGSGGGGGGGIPEAPIDGQQYARQDAAWSVVVSEGLTSPVDTFTVTDSLRIGNNWITSAEESTKIEIDTIDVNVLTLSDSTISAWSDLNQEISTLESATSKVVLSNDSLLGNGLGGSTANKIYFNQGVFGNVSTGLGGSLIATPDESTLSYSVGAPITSFVKVDESGSKAFAEIKSADSDSYVDIVVSDSIINAEFTQSLEANTNVKIIRDSVLAPDHHIKAKSTSYAGENVIIEGTIYADEVVNDSLLFNPIDEGFHQSGNLHYDNSSKSLVFHNDISGFNHNLGYEHVTRFYNNTGSTLTEGTIIRSAGPKVNSEVTFLAGLAGISSLDSLNGIAMVTANVLNEEYGVATMIGAINGLDLSMYRDNQVIYASHAGTYDTINPNPPYYSQIVGRINYADADSGQIYFYGFSESKYSPIPTFSALFEEQSAGITNPGINTYALITNGTNDLFTQDINYGFTLVGDSIQANQSGLYNVSFSYSFRGDASQNDEWRIGIFVNGIKEYSTTRTSSSNNAGGVPFSKDLDLDVDDWISVRVSNTESITRDCTFVDGIINITFITDEK